METTWKSKTIYVDIDSGEQIPAIDIINYQQLNTKKNVYIINGHGTNEYIIECKRAYERTLFDGIETNK